MLFNEKESGNAVFYFLGLPILQTLSELPKSYRLKELKLSASNQRNSVYDKDFNQSNSLKDLIAFFVLNDDYSIDNMDAILQNDIKISVHDDNEITFSFPKQVRYKQLIKKILNDYNYHPDKVLAYLSANKNQYLSIKKPDILEKKYTDFREYWRENS